MNGPIEILCAVIILLEVMTVLLLSGRGSFLIAGFNTADQMEKEKYDVKKLCQVTGGCIGFIGKKK